jgi:hypothetical protein
MQWLVTVAPGVDLKAVKAKLAARGGVIDADQPPIDQQGGGQTLYVDGAADFPSRVEDVPGILQVNPLSDQTKY